MTLFDLERSLKKLSPKFWINFNDIAFHPQLPDVKLVGLWYDQKHLGSLTLDTFVPVDDLFNQDGIITHRGLKHILRRVCSVEWVPTKTLNHRKEHQGHFFKAEFMRSKLKDAFGLTEVEIHKP